MTYMVFSKAVILAYRAYLLLSMSRTLVVLALISTG